MRTWRRFQSEVWVWCNACLQHETDYISSSPCRAPEWPCPIHGDHDDRFLLWLSVWRKFFFMYIDVPEGSSTTQIIRQFKNVTVLLTNSLIHLSCFIFVTLQYAFVFTAACWSAITSASLVRRRHDPRIYPNSSNPAGSIQFGRCTNWGQMNAYCGCHPRNGPNLWRKSQVHLIYYYLKHTTIFFIDPSTSPKKPESFQPCSIHSIGSVCARIGFKWT